MQETVWSKGKNDDFEMVMPGETPVTVRVGSESRTFSGDGSHEFRDAERHHLLGVICRNGILACTTGTKTASYRAEFSFSAEASTGCRFFSRRGETEFRIPAGTEGFVLSFDPERGFSAHYDEPEAAEPAGIDDPLQAFMGAADTPLIPPEPSPAPPVFPKSSSPPHTAPFPDETAVMAAQTEHIREIRRNGADAAYLNNLLSELELDMEILRHYRRDADAGRVTNTGEQDAADRAAAAFGYARALLAAIVKAREQKLRVPGGAG